MTFLRSMNAAVLRFGIRPQDLREGVMYRGMEIDQDNPVDFQVYIFKSPSEISDVYDRQENAYPASVEQAKIPYAKVMGQVKASSDLVVPGFRAVQLALDENGHFKNLKALKPEEKAVTSEDASGESAIPDSQMGLLH